MKTLLMSCRAVSVFGANAGSDPAERELRESHRLVMAKLTKKVQAEVMGSAI